jgi:hypothetical protein
MKIYKVFYPVLAFILLQIMLFVYSFMNFQYQFIVEFIAQYISITVISIYLLKINNREKKFFPYIALSIFLIMISHLLERLSHDYSKTLMTIGLGSLLFFYLLRFYNKHTHGFLDILKFFLVVFFCAHRVIFSFLMGNIYHNEASRFHIHYIGIKIIFLMLFSVYLYDYQKQIAVLKSR